MADLARRITARHRTFAPQGLKVQLLEVRQNQHQKTILIDFIDHLADFDRLDRADMLFAKDKVIGAPLISLGAVHDLPQAVKDRLFFMRFEDLTAKPAETMSKLYSWLDLSP